MTCSNVKICKKCNINKDVADFNKTKSSKDGLAFYCRACSKVILKNQYIKTGDRHRQSKKDKRKLGTSNDAATSRKSYSKNKETILEQKKDYYLKNRSKIDQAHAAYLKNNESSRIRRRRHNDEYDRKRKEIDPLYRLRKSLRTKIRNDIIRFRYSKKKSTLKMIGCTFEFLLEHLGPNTLKIGYHIDHMCPCAQAQNEEELLKLQHYTNLQVISSIENIKKSNKATDLAVQKCREILNREWI